MAGPQPVPVHNRRQHQCARGGLPNLLGPRQSTALTQRTRLSLTSLNATAQAKGFEVYVLELKASTKVRN